MSLYQQHIRELAPDEYEPRHVEAFMRLEHGTLDHLPREQFVREVEIGCACIDEAGHEHAEACARSFGL